MLKVLGAELFSDESALKIFQKVGWDAPALIAFGSSLHHHGATNENSLTETALIVEMVSDSISWRNTVVEKEQKCDCDLVYIAGCRLCSCPVGRGVGRWVE